MSRKLSGANHRLFDCSAVRLLAKQSAVSGQPLTRGAAASQEIAGRLPRVKGQQSARVPARTHSPFSILHSSFSRAFTLTELLVVIAIITLVAAFAIPAMGPMFKSNQTASAVSTIESLLVTAQAAAQAQGTPVALRIEQAYKTSPQGYMVDGQGRPPFQAGFTTPDSLRSFRPVPLDHQQVRIVNYSPSKDYLGYFVADSQSRPTALPSDVWLAPGDIPSPPARLVETALIHSDLSAGFVPYNTLDTFFIVFNGAGELTRISADHCWYVDRSQPVGPANPTRPEELYYPTVSRPAGELTPRSILAYDRRKWSGMSSTDGVGRDNLLRREGIPIYINRFTGAAVESKR
jgi:prepilin-type N-terminal cleavage/methylation domain-containing protein